VLKEDWDKEYEEQYYDDQEWWKTAWFRRTTIVVAGALVLASVGGGIHVVTRLPKSQIVWGWVLMCVGVALLLPAAIGIHYMIKVFQRLMNLHSERSGIVIRDGNDMSDTCHKAGCGGGKDLSDGQFSSEAGDNLDVTQAFNCEDLDMLDPQVLCDDNDIEMAEQRHRTERFSKLGAVQQQPLQQHQPVSETAGCYSIRFAVKSPQEQLHRARNSNAVRANAMSTVNNKEADSSVQGNSSASTVSSISLEDRSSASRTGAESAV